MRTAHSLPFKKLLAVKQSINMDGFEKKEEENSTKKKISCEQTNGKNKPSE